jgi:hypothetical protein
MRAVGEVGVGYLALGLASRGAGWLGAVRSCTATTVTAAMYTNRWAGKPLPVVRWSAMATAKIPMRVAAAVGKQEQQRGDRLDRGEDQQGRVVVGTAGEAAGRGRRCQALAEHHQPEGETKPGEDSR